MRSNRLWPVLIVLGVMFGGVGVLQWLASHHEPYTERVVVANSAGTESESDEVSDLSWQATSATSPEHARARQLLRRGDIDEALEIYEALVADDAAPLTLQTEYAYVL